MSRPMVGLVAVLLVALGWAVWQRDRALASVRAAGLARDAAEARADSTREVTDRVRGDLRTFVRRVEQVQADRDAMDRALDWERRARLAVEARVADLSARVDAPVTVDPTDSTVRRAAFTVREPPYTVEAEVALPPPPAGGTMRVRVGLDPLPLEVRLGCGAPAPDGVRPATVAVQGPTWATVRLGAVQQDPAVCQSPVAATRARPRWWPRLVAGYAVTAGGSGPGVMVGWIVWP